MRILHTGDWHVGKRLGRHDRSADFVAALDAVVEAAEREAVDLVLVAGDLFDRPMPPIEALELVLDTLGRLARPERPVVAIAGNHDSPELFELLAPLVRRRGIHLVGRIRAPGDGGVLELTAGGQRVLVACFPFLRQGKVVDFLDDVDSWYSAYAERVRKICASYDRHLERHGDGAVKLLTAHFMVDGALVGGGGAPRGERTLHLGEAYSATAQAIPAGAQYVALGHVHRPQPVPGSPVLAEYCGSPLELDFGEAGEEKRLVVVDVEPGLPATARSVPFAAGRRLLRLRGRWGDLESRDGLDDALLDLTVETDGPDPGLAERARQRFPLLVKVRAAYPRAERETAPRAGRPWDELYREYYRERHGAEPSAELLAALREVWGEEDVDAAA